MANRTVGFQRSAILTAFLAEALLLGFIGGVGRNRHAAGPGLEQASVLQSFTVPTPNFQTFAELPFQFRLSVEIVAEGLGFAVVMGLAGGLLPTVRAARMNIVEALREA